MNRKKKKVMHKIIEWIEYETYYENTQIYSFIPLRMTVSGKAGTGKSFLINQLKKSAKIILKS